MNIVSRFLEDASRALAIETPEDWYRVSLQQLARLGGKRIILKNGGLLSVLRMHYPQEEWDEARFTGPKKAGQRWLYVNVKRTWHSSVFNFLDCLSSLHVTKPVLFPDVEIVEDYRGMVTSTDEGKVSRNPLELDVYLPSLGLAFEYHGQQHYQDSMLFGTASLYQRTSPCFPH